MSERAVVLVASHSFLERDPRVRRTVDALLDDGWVVEGLFLDPPMRRGRLRTWRVPIRRRRGSPLRYLFEYGVFAAVMLLWVVARTIRSRPAVVYVNSPPELFVLAALPARWGGAAIVLDVHDPLPELLLAKGRRSAVLRRLLEAQERLSLRIADRVITVHEPLRDLLLERSPGVAIDVVMNVPDLSTWRPIEWDATSRTIMYTGSVAIRYGLDDVVEALALLADLPQIRLRIVGEGEDVDALRRLAAARGVERRVEFRGRVPYERVRDVQRDAWIGVNLPKPDLLGGLSFSNKIVEWVALGLPVIASRTSTLLRYFPEDTLVYVTPGDPAALADTIRELHEADPDTLRARVRRAQTALDRIAWPVQRGRLVEVVREAAAAGPR